MKPYRVLGRLWTHRKSNDTLICVLVQAPTGEEVRVLQGEAIYHSQICADRTAALRRAEQLRLELEAHGWIPSG